MVDIKGLIQVTPTERLNRDTSRAIGLVGIPSSNGQQPLAWVMSDEYKSGLEAEKRNLIKAKVRAIIGTAVFGAGLAICLGVIIGISHKKE